jgi:hypothetical protein
VFRKTWISGFNNEKETIDEKLTSDFHAVGFWCLAGKHSLAAAEGYRGGVWWCLVLSD